MKKNSALLWSGRLLVLVALLLRASGLVQVRSPLLWGLLILAAVLVLLSRGR